MKLFITVKPKSKEEMVEEVDETHLIVRVKAPASEGKANEAVTRVLANHFDTPISNVEIVSGYSSRKKVVSLFIPAPKI